MKSITTLLLLSFGICRATLLPTQIRRTSAVNRGRTSRTNPFQVRGGDVEAILMPEWQEFNQTTPTIPKLWLPVLGLMALSVSIEFALVEIIANLLSKCVAWIRRTPQSFANHGESVQCNENKFEEKTKSMALQVRGVDDVSTKQRLILVAVSFWLVTTICQVLVWFSWESEVAPAVVILPNVVNTFILWGPVLIGWEKACANQESCRRNENPSRSAALRVRGGGKRTKEKDDRKKQTLSALIWTSIGLGAVMPQGLIPVLAETLVCIIVFFVFLCVGWIMGEILKAVVG